MDRLSACYFCGAATVGDLGRVRVDGDESAAVTLCGDCTDKLDRLAGAADAALSVRVGDASPGDGEAGGTRADASPATESGAARTDTPSGAETTEASPSDPPTADPAQVADVDDERESSAGDGPAATDVGDAPGIPDDAQILTDDEDSPGSDRLAGSHDPTKGGPVDDPEHTDGADLAGDDARPAPHDTAERSDDGPLIPDEDDADADRSFDTSQAAGGRRETSHDPRQRRSDRRSSPSDADSAPDDPRESTGGTDTDGATPAPDDGDEGGPDPSDVDVATVPRQTYNKVVRLLQNRSFPVERDTVVSVATSAYGLSRRNCDATLDALVEHGVLDESEDGERLYRT